MAGYNGLSMSNNAVQAYAEGKKPVSRITREDILEHGISESVTMFRWYVQKYCRWCEWHHSSPKFNITRFYDIESCCNQFKRQDIEKLKAEYKKRPKPKPVAKTDEQPYYAKVEYSVSTRSGRRKYIETYAVICGCWAYIKDDYWEKVIRKKIDASHFAIVETFQSRPDDIPEDVASEVMTEINKGKGNKCI